MPLDFPSNPTNGQVYNNFYYNSARGAWNALLPAATPNFFTNATLNDSTLNSPNLIDATVTASVNTLTPLTINGLSGQAGDLQQWKDSGGTVLSRVRNTGQIGVGPLITGNSMHVNALSASIVGLVVRGFASQTADLQQWQTSAGTVFTRVNSSGYLGTERLGVSSNATTIPSTAMAYIESGSSGNPSLILRAAASQTADLQQWQSSTGAVLSDINSAGELQVPRIGIGSVMPTTTHLFVNAAAAANIPIIAQGAASQTGDLQRWQDSSGTVLADVDSLGNMQAPKLGLGGSAPPTSPSSTNLQVTGRAKILSNGSESAGIWITGSSDVDTAFIGQTSPTTTDPVGIYHSGAWRFTVDSSGRVNTPTQPMISGQMGTLATFSGPALVPFDDFWISSRGISYNSSTRRFTVPAAGIYRITMNPFTNPSGAQVRIYIGVNTDAPAGSTHRGHAYKQPIDHNTLSLNSLVQLNANDYVVFYLASGVLYNASNDRFNQFSIEMVA
jgi:hypothetical protein